VPAPESSHALAQVRREALACAESGEEKVIVAGLSGHGLLELGAYADYLSDHLDDDPLSEAALVESLAAVPTV
jgi:tryptophan synthase beta chain